MPKSSIDFPRKFWLIYVLYYYTTYIYMYDIHDIHDIHCQEKKKEVEKEREC